MIKPNWKLHHIAHAVFDIDAKIRFYQQLAGLTLSSREIVQEQAVEVAFLDSGSTKIELLSPTDKSSSVHRFLEKHSEGLHHICFEVSDIDQELARLAKESIQLIDSIARQGAGGVKIAFLHPKSCAGVLIELYQGKHKT